MSITIPARDLSMADKNYYRSQVLVQAKTRLKQLMGYSEFSELDLSPQHLGLNSWATPALSARAWNPWINVTVGNNKVIAIYKFLQLSLNPSVTSLKIWLGPRANCMGIHELEHCYSGLPIIQTLARSLLSQEAKAVLDRMTSKDDIPVHPDLGSPMEGYFSEPYILDPDNMYQIEVKARQDSPGDYLVLGGYVIEPRGQTIA